MNALQSSELFIHLAPHCAVDFVSVVVLADSSCMLMKDISNVMLALTRADPPEYKYRNKVLTVNREQGKLNIFHAVVDFVIE